MSQYNTRQKSAVISFFAAGSSRAFTPEEVASALPDVPRSTVYRIIKQLSDDGCLRKTGTSGRSAVYQYLGKDCMSHMHIRCRVCGRTAHLDAATTRQIEALVSSGSGFEALDSTVLEGLCSECRRRG